MPELPEVETVRTGLAALLAAATIERFSLARPDLRRPIPSTLPRRLRRQPVLGVRRRAKWLLIDTPACILMSHLGMTGTWRLGDNSPLDLHDHACLELSDGRQLRFRDPRRFGMLDACTPGQEDEHPALAKLGPDAIDPVWTAAAFRAACRGRRAAIKSVLLDQHVVAGIGNIYAAEALFRAGIDPHRPADSLAAVRVGRLVTAVKSVLLEAIAAGGSTIGDFRSAEGLDGRFQHRFLVYDRFGQPCPSCRKPLSGSVIAGRATVWCASCQR